MMENAGGSEHVGISTCCKHVRLKHVFSTYMFAHRETIRKAKTRDLKKLAALEAKAAEFKEQVIEVFPYLGDEYTIQGGVAIGSGYDWQDKKDPEFRKFCRFELQLRVGLGHELLQDLRTAVSIAYRFIGEQKATWGVTQTQELSVPQKKAASRTSRVVADYVHNWRKIEILLASNRCDPADYALHLRGLQKLDPQKDVKYYKTDGVQTQSYMGYLDKDVSWIWHVPMLGVSFSNDREQMTKALEEWIDECELNIILFKK